MGYSPEAPGPFSPLKRVDVHQEPWENRPDANPNPNPQEPMDAETPWLSIPEAARRLGVTPQAIRKRLKRGTLQSRRNNRGQEIVQVPGVAERPDGVANQQAPVQELSQPNGSQPSGLVSLADVRQLLGEQAERFERQHREQVEVLRSSLQEANRDAIGLLVERVDAAEVRAEAAEQRLADSRRPWWARWLGTLAVLLVAF